MNYSTNLQIVQDQTLGKFSTFQVGGRADYFLAAKRGDELLEALDWAKVEGLPVYVFGGGSNILFADEGFRGLVIRMQMDTVRVEGEQIWAEAGAKMARVLAAALEAELTGLEPWTGLPGTVGGAVYGNAGCFDLETADCLVEADVWFPEKGVVTLPVEELGYGYRESRLKHERSVVLAARFQLRKGARENIDAQMKEVARARMQKQPPGASTGSFFKNPPGEHSAGWLIDQCGLKGHQIGGAQISPHHANFFINKGGATATDILTLAEHVEDTVWQRFAIRLEREVQIVL